MSFSVYILPLVPFLKGNYIMVQLKPGSFGGGAFSWDSSERFHESSAGGRRQDPLFSWVGLGWGEQMRLLRRGCAARRK